MHNDEDVELNVKVIALAIGGAALAAILLALARRDDKPATPAEKVAEVADDVEQSARKAAKAAKKKRKAFETAAAAQAEQFAHAAQERLDRKAVEQELKAAAWDAQQQASEAEGRLRAAGGRVREETTHLASRVGAEARHLAEGGRERISHLRRHEEGSPAEEEIARLKAELEDLRRQFAGSSRRGPQDHFGIASRLAGKTGPIPEAMASHAATAALAHLEKSLKAKAPQLMAARNKAQVIEILQRELGPTLRESAMQAVSAALSQMDTAGEKVAAVKAEMPTMRRGEPEKDLTEALEDLKDEGFHRAAEVAEPIAEAANGHGRMRIWRAREVAHPAEPEAETPIAAAVEADAPVEEHAKSGKAGLFWGGAGLGLALYILADPERRDSVLKYANEASIQVQELVRDLQGYDDEF